MIFTFSSRCRYIANHVVNPNTSTLLDSLWNAGLSSHSSSFPKEVILFYVVYHIQRILFFIKNLSVSFFVNLLHINTIITSTVLCLFVSCRRSFLFVGSDKSGSESNRVHTERLWKVDLA